MTDVVAFSPSILFSTPSLNILKLLFPPLSFLPLVERPRVMIHYFIDAVQEVSSPQVPSFGRSQGLFEALSAFLSP